MGIMTWKLKICSGKCLISVLLSQARSCDLRGMRKPQALLGMTPKVKKPKLKPSSMLGLERFVGQAQDHRPSMASTFTVELCKAFPQGLSFWGPMAGWGGSALGWLEKGGPLE